MRRRDSNAADGAKENLREIAPDVFCLGPWGRTRTAVYFVRAGSSWVLIDAGWPGDGPAIGRAAAAVFGPDAAPAAILLTHAHPDHEGDALSLARRWGCPVYLSDAELPIARRDFAAMTATAMPLDRWLILPALRAIGRRRRERLFARASLAPVAVGLTPGAPVPGLPGWECIATPGHTPGHVSFFRPADRVLISGDALVTARIDTVLDLLLQRQGLSVAPWFTTWNRNAARESMTTLARLRPSVLAGGHGEPLTGPDTADRVAAFAESDPPDRLPGGVTVVNRARIEREPEAVFDYLADLRNELRWNDKLRSVEPLTEGPLGAGSRYRVRFTGSISASGGGSDVTLATTLFPRGALRPLGRLVGRIMDVAWQGHLATVKRSLEASG